MSSSPSRQAWLPADASHDGRRGPIARFLTSCPLDVLLWMLGSMALCFLLLISWLMVWSGVKPYWVIIPCVLLIPALHAIALSIFQRVKWSKGSVSPDKDANRFLRRFGAIIGEWLALIVLFTFMQPFSRIVMPVLEKMSKLSPQERSHKDTSQPYPVLLIHGFLCNAMFWMPTRLYLGRAGMRDIFTITLDPCLGDITKFSESVSDKVDKILQETGAKKVIIVGHSMGGVVGRQYVLYHGGSDKVAKIIAVGAPNHGSQLVSIPLLRPLRHICVCLCQMNGDSSLLEEQNQIEMHGVVPITNIFSYDDELVLPQESSILDVKHAKTIACSGMGHLSMPFSRSINAHIRQELINVTHPSEILC